MRYESPCATHGLHRAIVPSNEPLGEKAICTSWSALWGFPLLTKTLSPHVKNYDNCVCESQSAADMSLALFGAMNGWQCVLFLKHELNRVLLVRNNHVYIKKQNNTWGLGEVEFLFEGST